MSSRARRISHLSLLVFLLLWTGVLPAGPDQNREELPDVVREAGEIGADFNSLWDLWMTTSEWEDDPLLTFFEERARSEADPDLYRTLLARIRGPGDGDQAEIPEPTDTAWAAMARGFSALARTETEEDPADGLAEARAAAEVLRSLPDRPRESVVFLHVLGLRDGGTRNEEGSGPVPSPEGEQEDLLAGVLRRGEGSSGLLSWAAESFAASQPSWFGASEQDLSERRELYLGGLRSALRVDRGWSRKQRQGVRRDLALALLHDRFRQRPAPEEGVLEGRAMLRELLEEDPGDLESRRILAADLGGAGEFEAAARVLSERPAGVEARVLESMAEKLASALAWWEGRSRVDQVDGRVRIRFPVPSHLRAQQGWITGDFDGWLATRFPATREGNLWEVSLDLGPGRYRYQLRVGSYFLEDPAGAPASCEGSPCFEIGEDGKLRPPARQDPEWLRMHARALGGEVVHPLRMRSCLQALAREPLSQANLLLLSEIMREAGQGGRVLEVYRSLAPEQGRTPAGERFLEGLLDDAPYEEADFAPGGALASLKGCLGPRLLLSRMLQEQTEPGPDPAASLALARELDACSGQGEWTIRAVLENLAASPEGRALVEISREAPGFRALWAEALVARARQDETLVKSALAVSEEVAGSAPSREGSRAWWQHFQRLRSLETESRPVLEPVLLRGLERFPESYWFRFAAGEWALGWKQREKLLELLEKAPEGGESAAGRLLARGRLLRVQGGSARAEAALEAALALDPTDPGVLHELGGLHIEGGQGTQGIELLMRARASGLRSDQNTALLMDNLLLSQRFGEVRKLWEGGLEEETRYSRIRPVYCVQVAVAGKQVAQDPAELLPLLREGLSGLDDQTDPTGSLRWTGHFLLWEVATKTGDAAALRRVGLFFGSRPWARWVAFGLGLAVLLVCTLVVGLLLLVLRRRPVLRTFLVAGPFWLALLATQLLVAGAYSWWAFDGPGEIFLAPHGSRASLAFLAGFVVMTLPMSCYALFEFWLQGVSARDLGLHRGPRWPDMRKALGTWGRLLFWNVSIFMVLGLLLHLSGTSLPSPLTQGENLSQEMIQVVGVSGGALGLYFVVVLLAPLAEELFFRGLLYGTWRKRLGPWPAAILSSLFFGMVHLQRVLPLTVVGIFFARSYEESETLWVPVLAHTVLNAFAVGVRIMAWT